MSTQAPPSTIHLNRYYHFTELMRDPAIEGQLLRYQSAHDESLQTALILRPAAVKSDKLFFFFHGMDGDSGDGVVVRDLVKSLEATVVSMGGRGPSWVSSAFLADAEQVIRTYSVDFQDYYLIGVSMGGTQALSLAGLLPGDLRQRVQGVIALIPGSDLPAIVARSANERVKSSLKASVDGDPKALEQRSPARAMESYRTGLPFVIFYRREDTLLLSDELETFIANLRRRHHPVSTFSAPGEHNFTYKNFDYRKIFKELGNEATQTVEPLTATEQG
jgi:pimeloyl-ACP methyl ester carboxylesterase